MKLNGTALGSITIDDIVYSHDVLIRLSGAVEKRGREPYKYRDGTSHVRSLEDALVSCEKPSRGLIIGTGQSGNWYLSRQGAGYFLKNACGVVDEPTRQGIVTFNKTRGAQIGLLHGTC